MTDSAHDQALRQSIGSIIGSMKRFETVLSELPEDEQTTWLDTLKAEQASSFSADSLISPVLTTKGTKQVAEGV